MQIDSKNILEKKIGNGKYRLLSVSRKRLVIWGVSVGVFLFLSFMIDPLNPGWSQFFNKTIGKFIYDLTWLFGICILLAEISLMIDAILNRKLPWTDKPRKRIIWQAILLVLGSLAVVLLIYMLVISVEPTKHIKSIEELSVTMQLLVTNFMVSIVITAINTGDYLLYNWTQSAVQATAHQLEAVKFEQAAIAAELQALKLQIDPHFIFNNLSVLAEITRNDQEAGVLYAENFSKVYRYTLLNSKKDLIPLADELRFLEAYRYLIAKRFGAAVIFDIEVAPELQTLQLPPMTLQFLVENAIKHNQTRKETPLQIFIKKEDATHLVVINTLDPMPKTAWSSGLGLENITNRYLLLSQEKPVMYQTTDYFIVKLPLIS
ncbi:sensor histidine kinase [Neptunitalea lumnitzerae]|nr:histidine kinase [Neptunitalea sp. Y10]